MVSVMAKQVYLDVTNKIIEMMETSIDNWEQPWVSNNSGMPKRFNGEHYNGINVLLLWIAKAQNQYKSDQWMTFNQIKELGGNVKKGSKSEKVIFYKPISVTDTDSHGNEINKTFPLLKTYNVFNVDQTEGLSEKYYPTTTEKRNINKGSKDQVAEAFFNNIEGLKVEFGADLAAYYPSLDMIKMPDFERFLNSESYYSTLAHETIHWTKSKNRLDRSFGESRFGNESYAMEELVAELGAAFIMADLQLSNVVRIDHVSYIKAWIKILKNDPKAIFTASSYATKAVTYLTKQNIK